MASKKTPKGGREILRAYREAAERVREFFRESGKRGGQKGGSLGGKTAAAHMTPEERKARAEKAAAASVKARAARKAKGQEGRLP